MTTTSTDISRDEWLKALADIEAESDPLALTSSDLSRLWNCSMRETTRRLQKLKNVGRVIRTQKVISYNNGARHTAPAYRLIEKRS